MNASSGVIGQSKIEPIVLFFDLSFQAYLRLARELMIVWSVLAR
jgi:hypothetical protein